MRAFAALAVLVLVAGCQTAPVEMTETEIAQIEAEINQALDDFVRVFGEMDCDNVQALYHPERAAVPRGSRVVDYADLRDFCTSFMEGKDAWQGYWAETNIRVISPDLVEYSGIMGDTIWFSDGRVVEWPGNCANVGVLARTAEGWKQTVVAQTCGSSQRVEGG